MTEISLEIKSDDITRFADKFSLGRDRGMGSSQFLRIKVAGGILTSEHLLAIAEISDQYGRGYAEITDRQDIQLHWIQGKDALKIFAKLDQLGFTTDKCGQSFPGARYGDTRNVGVCPISGLNKHELIDVAPIAKKINDFFIGNHNYLDMPRKFKISITGCELGCTRPEIQDLGLFALKKDGRIGFAAILAGSLGPSMPGPRLGKPLGVFICPEEVFDVAKAMADLFNEHGNRESKPRARFKWLVEGWGLEKIRDEFERKLGRKLERFDHGYPDISGEEHVGIQEQKDGLNFISVPVIGGKLSSEKLKKIADIAKSYGKGEIRITSYQNFILPHIPKEKLDEALKEFKKIDLQMEVNSMRFVMVACASDFCGKSVEPHTKQMAGKILEHLENRFGDKLGDMKLSVRISGCMHDCGLHQIGHIGLLGVKEAGGESPKQFYNLSICGELGKNASLSHPIARVLKPDKAISAVENLVEAYLNDGFKDFREFYRGHKLEDLKTIVSKEK